MTAIADRAPAASARTEVDVERAVRNRLYGERSDIVAAPVARTPVAVGPPPRLLGERYRLLRLIGTGGMSKVYCARDELLKRRVAVKVLGEPLASEARHLRRFRREAELWAGLVHHRIVAVFDAGAAPRPFIVMELVRGMDSGALARGSGPLASDAAIRIVAQVAEALAFAHEHEVIHRDVSAGNVLIRRSDGAVKLTDFGLACRVGEAAARDGGGVAGTYGYMAPEVLRGEAMTPLTDLYALGALAHLLLAGPPEPRSSATTGRPRAWPRRRPLAEVRPGLPAAASGAIDRALEEDPGARQPSVAEFRAQLLAGAAAPVARLSRRAAA